jgi:hypothetical protein
MNKDDDINYLLRRIKCLEEAIKDVPWFLYHGATWDGHVELPDHDREWLGDQIITFVASNARMRMGDFK